MTDVFLAFQGSAPANTNKTWNNVQTGSSALALNESTGASSGLSLTAAAVAGAIEIAVDVNTVPTGDAAWVDELPIARWGHYKNSATEWASYTITGGTPNAPVTYYSFCSAGFGRLTEVRVNGGTSQTQDSNVNKTEVLVFNTNFDGSGNLVIEHRQGAGSSGSAYQNAGWLSYGGAADTTAPTISSASVPTSGDTIAVQMSEAMQVGAGGAGGWTISLGDATISSAAVDGTDNTIINLTPSRTLLSGESFTIGYTQPGDGFQDQAATPNDLATLSGASVTNNSSQGSLSIGTVDTDDAVNQYQQSVTIPLTNFSEEITAVTLDAETCAIQSQVIGTSVTVDFPGNLATGTYTLSVSGATESATKSIDYTQTHPYTSPVGSVDSNSLFSSPVLITAGTYHRIVSGPSNGTLDAAGAESGSLWANDVADIYTPNEGFTGNDSVQIEVLFDDGTTDTINATITVETPVDTTPDQFDLGANVTGAEPGATVQRTFVLAGIDPGETVSPSATGSATVSPGTAQAGDTITVELTAGAFEAVVSGGVTINGVSDSFSVTSRAAVLPTQDVVLPDLSLGETDAVSIDLDNYFSGASSYTLTGLPAGSGLSLSGSVLSGNVNKDDIAASPYTLTANAISADGSINDAFSVTVVDDIAPVISINPLTTLDTSPIVSGSAGDATSLTLVVNAVTYNPAPSGGAWSQQLPTLALGSYAMTLDGQDGAGNAATQKTAFLNIVEASVSVGGRRGFKKSCKRSMKRSIVEGIAA